MVAFVLLYLVNFLRTLFIILVIYYGIRLFTRYVLPLLIDKGIKNMQQKMNEHNRDYKRSSRPDGEVTIEYNRSNPKKKQDDQGEYVDFEEVD